MDTNEVLYKVRRAAVLGRGGDAIDGLKELDAVLTEGARLPDDWRPREEIQWVADDSEECDMCAYPESSRVYLRIGDTLVCQEHVWRGLVAVLGTHPRHLPPAVPADHPVRVLGPDDPATDRVTCGTCGRAWDDAIATSWTPAPSGRCPFDYWHARP